MKNPRIIGFCGGAAAGKTEIVNIIHECLDNISICIPQDNYYLSDETLSFSEREKINFDAPSAFDVNLLASHLKILKKQNEIDMPQYSYIEHLRLTETLKIKSNRIILLDGLYLFHFHALRELIDIKIFVDTSENVRLDRMIKRNERERNENANNTTNRFYLHVKPMHDLYIEAQKKYANLIVDNNKSLNEAKEKIMYYLKDKFKDIYTPFL